LSVYDNIDFRGMIKRVDVYHEMRNADLYISASSFEGMPVTALEAMYIGMPVLLSKIPAHEEVYKQNEIYNMFDISASNISHEINTIMSTYEKHGKYLGELNIEHVRSNYSLKSSQDRWTLLYDRLLNKKIKLQ